MDERRKVLRIIFLYGSATDPFDQLRRITHDKNTERPEFTAFRRSHRCPIDETTYEKAPTLIKEAALSDSSGIPNQCAVIIRLEAGSHYVVADLSDILHFDDLSSLIAFLKKNEKDCNLDMGFPP
jgi:hypothetical protein